MFEPKTHWEKRAALNEITLQQLFQLIPKNDNVAHVFSSFMQRHQMLRDVEANRVLGEREFGDGDVRITRPFIEETLRLNLGRTYFNLQGTAATHEGAIGTPNFAHKYKTWIDSVLPDFDSVFVLDESGVPGVKAGFVVDRGNSTQIPLLILPVGDEVHVIAFHAGSVVGNSVNLAKMPEGYAWGRDRAGLRAEFFSFREQITRVEFLEQFGRALSSQGQNTLYVKGLFDEELNRLTEALSGIISISHTIDLPNEDVPAGTTDANAEAGIASLEAQASDTVEETVVVDPIVETSEVTAEAVIDTPASTDTAPAH